MSSDHADAVLKWLAVVVPGLSAGLGWAITAGWPTLNRILAGIAIGVTIYAVIHVAMKATGKNH